MDVLKVCTCRCLGIVIRPHVESVQDARPCEQTQLCFTVTGTGPLCWVSKDESTLVLLLDCPYVVVVLISRCLYAHRHSWPLSGENRYTIIDPLVHPRTFTCVCMRCVCIWHTHTSSCIDPPSACGSCVCVHVCCAGPTVYHTSRHLSDEAGWGGGFSQRCALRSLTTWHSVHACVCQRPTHVCVWMEFIPAGPDAPAKSITSGAAQRC